MHLGYRLAIASIVLVTLAGQQACMNHHECDTDTFGSHCESGQRVTCEDRTQGEPCASDQGCDTYITRTTCEAASACVTDSASRAVCQGALAPAACGLGATLPLPPIGVSVIVPEAIVADFNGDGRADIVTYVPTRYTVSLGNGDGTFHALPAQSFGTQGNDGEEAEGVNGVVAGDFDGDKRVDLAFVDFRPNSVVVVLLGAGDGTFHAGATTTACFTTPGVADLDGDGTDDLADGTSVLFGAANGAFRGVQPTTGPSGGGCYAGFSPGQIAIGDFDGDGKLDVAGAGGSIVDFDASGKPSPSLQPIDRTAWLAAGDADGDKIADLVMVTTTGVAFRHGRKGTTLDNPIALAAAPYAPSRVSFADIDGDGQLDVVATDPEADVVLLWKNLGHATFSPTPTAIDPLKDASDLAGVSDFDHDGKADLVLRANRTVGVVKDGCGAF